MRLLNAREQKFLETATLKEQEKHKAVTERCLRTAYFIAYQNQPLSHYPDLFDLQERNGVVLGTTFQSRFSCTEMISGIAQSGVGKRLKEQLPVLFIWNCMNHRLELAVADAIKEIDAFQALESLFNKIYSLYSISSKLQRELKEIASKLDVELKVMGKVFTIRWAASTYIAVNALWSSFQEFMSTSTLYQGTGQFVPVNGKCTVELQKASSKGIRRRRSCN